METIPETILAQLGGARRLSAMIGAHTFTQDETALTFKFKARAKGGINCIRVIHDPTDTYRVEFIRIRGVDTWTKGDFSFVNAENLQRLIESETGLYLSL